MSARTWSAPGVVTGRVQGVGFRFTTVDEAQRLGVPAA